ncbi:hypothetical protein [Streptomyces sp. B1I3]|uniref:hypothetical protein n=1 Tax=Streptomyces sp. B1I3 TaxID=3042264 RepID=UPI0027860BBE|nr:hypothetical protein [Streptomyces sp. B1I3]MDQ0795467.1 hypothetical protein [Streptomyces sp. B1I3]
MSTDAAPDPTEVPDTPERTGAQGHGCAPADVPDGVGEDGPEEEGFPEEDAVADDEGLRWAALLAAFINDVQPPPPGTPPAH